jgi:Dienelactone hydrolase and related enzymes
MIPQTPTLFLASDVFGYTSELQVLTRNLAARARIVSPYGADSPQHHNETDAYADFSTRTSVETYADEITGELRRTAYDLVVGFSVGATALWLALAHADILPPKRTILYYGSRIRQYAHLRPQGNIQLIFAEKEASFHPAELVKQLNSADIDAQILPGTAHGFMNPFSPGFNAGVYAAEMARLQGLLP